MQAFSDFNRINKPSKAPKLLQLHSQRYFICCVATVICEILFNKCVTNYIYSKHCFAPNLVSTWPIQSKPTTDMSSSAKSWRLDETAVNSLWFANNVNTLRPGNFWGSVRYSDSKSRPTVTLQSYSATGRQDAGHVQINVLELCHKIREIREWLALRRTRCSLHAHSASERNVLGFICREVSTPWGEVCRKLPKTLDAPTAGQQLMTWGW